MPFPRRSEIFAPGCEGMWASISGDRAGSELRQDCSGAAAMTSMIDW